MALGTIKTSSDRSRLPGLAVGGGKQEGIKLLAWFRIDEPLNRGTVPDCSEINREASTGRVSEFILDKDIHL